MWQLRLNHCNIYKNNFQYNFEAAQLYSKQFLNVGIYIFIRIVLMLMTEQCSQWQKSLKLWFCVPHTEHVWTLVAYNPNLSSKLLRCSASIDLHHCPLLCIMYILSYKGLQTHWFWHCSCSQYSPPFSPLRVLSLKVRGSVIIKDYYGHYLAARWCHINSIIYIHNRSVTL